MTHIHWWLAGPRRISDPDRLLRLRNVGPAHVAPPWRVLWFGLWSLLALRYQPGWLDEPAPLDLAAIEANWLRQCGPHDFGVDSVGCACPDGEPRAVISRLVDEVKRLRGGEL